MLALTRAWHMNSKPNSLLMRFSIIIAILVAWLSVSLLITFRTRPSRKPSVVNPDFKGTTAACFLPDLYTVPGGPVVLAAQSRNGSPVVLTQFPLPTLAFEAPSRYIVTDAADTSREVQPDVRSLGLFDFRYQPGTRLDEMK